MAKYNVLGIVTLTGSARCICHVPSYPVCALIWSVYLLALYSLVELSYFNFAQLYQF